MSSHAPSSSRRCPPRTTDRHLNTTMIKSVTRGRPTEMCCPEKPSSGVATSAPTARAPRGGKEGGTWRERESTKVSLKWRLMRCCVQKCFISISCNHLRETCCRGAPKRRRRVCVCMCVRETEKERQESSKRERDRGRDAEGTQVALYQNARSLLTSH